MVPLERFQGLIGIVVLLGIAWLMSENRRRVPWRLVFCGLAMQVLFAVVVLRTPVGQPFFRLLNNGVNQMIAYTDVGTAFLFKPLRDNYETRLTVREARLPTADGIGNESPAETPATPETSPPLPPGTELLLESADGPQLAPQMMNFAFFVLPTVIFFSALLSVLYHIGLMQWIVKGLAQVMMRTLGTSGAETLSVAANIFVGQTEAPLMVQPFLRTMTRSELLTIMLAGFATIAGGVLVLYVRMLESQIPDIAGHLMAASVMCAPATFIVAKILLPETETPVTASNLNIEIPRVSSNVIDAFGDGVTQGLQLTLNIGAMLIAFVAAVALINGSLSYIPVPEDSDPITLQGLFGTLFQPLAWTLGVTWSEARTLGALLGEKLVLTELIAYRNLGAMEVGRDIQPRTAIIASYALCGFANFASVGIQLGGIGAMAPERKADIASLVMRAMIGGAIATALTAAIAGLLL